MAGIEGYSVTAGSNNNASPNGWPEGMAPSGVNDADRQFAAVVRAEWAVSSLTATATMSIGNNAAGVGAYIHVCTDANKSISSFDTIAAGIRRVLIFDVAATIVHDATKLICPGAASIPVAAGAIAEVLSEGAGNWRMLDIQHASGGERIASLTFIIDGAGAAITTGIKGDLRVPFGCTINSATLLADQSGSIVIDIWKDTLANYPPTVADTITAAAKPTLTTATNSEDTTLTGWTKTVTAGDTLRFNVDSITTCTRVTLALKVTKT